MVSPSDSPLLNPAGEDGWTVDWLQVVVGLVAAIATAVFDSLARVVGAAWQAVIGPVQALGYQLSVATGSLTNAIAGSLSFGAAIDLARSLGWPVAVGIVAVGVLVLAYVVSEVRG